MILASLSITESEDGSIVFDLTWGKNKASKKEKKALKAVREALEKPLNKILDRHFVPDENGFYEF